MAKWNKIRDRKAKGKKTGVVVQKEGSDKQVTLLNPHGKFNKATEELKQGVHLTNEGEVKCDKQTGEVMKLTSEEKAFRNGYRSAMIDSARAYNATSDKNS